MTKKVRRGKRGEDIACRFLEKEGYKILERNFRCRQGEIDVIAEEDEVLCFIEVKSRTSKRFGLPEESVTSWKRKRLLTTAFLYIEQKNVGQRAMRFDIVSVDLNDEKTRLIKNAFEAEF